MSVTVHDVQQRSEEWFALRAGRLTGSQSHTMLNKVGRGGKGEAVGRRDLRIRLACEQYLKRSLEDAGYVSPDMRRGIEKEPEAIAAYEAAEGVIVRKSGFLAHDALQIGCSLDGYIGNFRGFVEVKAPKTATHLQYLRIETIEDVPDEYRAQITHNFLLVPSAEYADFVSFDDRVPEPLQLFRFRIHRDWLDLAAYELEARQFLSEVERELRTFDELIAKRLLPHGPYRLQPVTPVEGHAVTPAAPSAEGERREAPEGRVRRSRSARSEAVSGDGKAAGAWPRGRMESLGTGSPGNPRSAPGEA